MIGLGRKDFAVLENRLNGLAMNLVRIGGGYLDLGEFLRLVQHHVAHIQHHDRHNGPCLGAFPRY